MRLVKCHIENFGKLTNFDFDFTGGLNCINQANGWGKSTFATFIKAMFYGLPSTSKKKLDENERKKYLPWQGGNYGGNLVFALGQKQYKIERFFGKNNAEDSFTLIDLATGKQSHDFTENLGAEIFGLDEAAFERSVYIPQKELDSSINESIAQKLTNLVQGTNENYHYEDAYARLDKQRSVLSNNKKTGQIQNLASEIEDLTAQIRELENRGRAVPEIQKQIDQQDVKLVELVQQQNQIKVQINAYGQLQQKTAHQAMFDKLNRQVLTTQVTIQAKQAVLGQHTLTATEQTAVASDYAVQRYQNLHNYFGGKIPTAETAQAVYQDVLRLNTLQTASSTIATGQGQNRQRHRWLSWGLLAVAILCIFGAVIALKPQWILAVGLFVVGGVALLAAGYLSLVNLINVKTSVPSKVSDASLRNDSAVENQLEQSIAAFVNQYEASTVDHLTAINRVLANVREYNQLRTQLEMDLNALRARLQNEQQELAQFKNDNHFQAGGAVVDVDINELQKRERELQNQIDALREEKAHLLARIQQIQDALAGLDDLENEKANLQSNLKTLEQEFSAIKHAMAFLQAASESMSTKFLAPMKNGLTKYLTTMTGAEFNHLNLDTELKIAFEEYGKLREVDYYSQGYRNMIDLCMRFALIDTLFKQEKPFIVLDDPLVNLDDVKVEKTKAFLQKLAQDYQLIYFSCHQSRC